MPAGLKAGEQGQVIGGMLHGNTQGIFCSGLADPAVSSVSA
jgi:hypothetical protein